MFCGILEDGRVCRGQMARFSGKRIKAEERMIRGIGRVRGHGAQRVGDQGETPW